MGLATMATVALASSVATTVTTTMTMVATAANDSGSDNVTAIVVAVGDGDDPMDEYQPLSERWETYLVPVVFFIIFVVGVLGNGTLVVIFLKHRAMRNVPNTYIFSLALADLLVIISVVPFTSVIYTLESWPWGPAICKLSEAVKDISIGVSVFTLTALSAERYCAIVNPLKRFQTKPLTVFSAIFIWIVAALLAIPDALFSDLQPVDPSGELVYCSPFPAVMGPVYPKYLVVAKAFIYYFLPLAIIAIFYVLMAQRLHASARDMPGEQQGQGVAQARARKHVARMVLAFVFLFFLCFLPYHFFMLWFILNPHAENEYNDFWHALKIIGFCLTFLNSCVNPVALYCVSGVFRQHYNHYLCCRSSRRLQRNMPMGGNCETSFNSTYRRHTQATTIDSHSIYRKHQPLSSNLLRQNTVLKEEALPPPAPLLAPQMAASAVIAGVAIVAPSNGGGSNNHHLHLNATSALNGSSGDDDDHLHHHLHHLNHRLHNNPNLS